MTQTFLEFACGNPRKGLIGLLLHPSTRRGRGGWNGSSGGSSIAGDCGDAIRVGRRRRRGDSGVCRRRQGKRRHETKGKDAHTPL